MTPIDQNLFGEGKGNCFAACVASVLGVPLETVPNFCVDGGEAWGDYLREWLRGRGLGVCHFMLKDTGWKVSDIVGHHAFVLVGGKSPRGDFLHECVYKGDELAHDPHPDRTGLESIEDVTVIFPLDLAKAAA